MLIITQVLSTASPAAPASVIDRGEIVVWAVLSVVAALLVTGWFRAIATRRFISLWRMALQMLGLGIVSLSLLAMLSGRFPLRHSILNPIWLGLIGLGCAAFGKGLPRIATLCSGVIVTGIWYVIALSSG